MINVLVTGLLFQTTDTCGRPGLLPAKWYPSRLPVTPFSGPNWRRYTPEPISRASTCIATCDRFSDPSCLTRPCRAHTSQPAGQLVDGTQSKSCTRYQTLALMPDAAAWAFTLTT